MLLTTCLLASAAAASAQGVIDATEELDFDRTEAWAMKYFASLMLFTGLGVPERMGSGATALGFEGGFVPQLSEEQRRVGFDGTKVEDLNRTRFFGRLRGTVGLSEEYSLELAYLPPIDVGGTKPHLFAAAVGRPFTLSEGWELGLRGYGQLGTIRGDITCTADEASAGDDLELNPFLCRAPSNDAMKQRLLGAELTAGYLSDSRFRPHFGVGINYMDLEFQVDAEYADAIDRTLQLTNGTTVSLVGGLTYVPAEKWRITGEVFYSWLSVVRPPQTSSHNDGLLNVRFLVSYRIR
jgi:hypothetical protein